ncbi:alanine racemase [Weissella diestrammenae]|uniref:Alanine racemase n=1 Tax=Weissella diestrammenae TaxID=1162633 RepID=A0A7G9T485_9LACO|nr:alanine racemase [Weissella diestrammenae]MCM0583437.1 alanine racemase [Weissella diestrammenae]QNN74910.1 alanine racemase [Weissella diestrammenae]
MVVANTRPTRLKISQQAILHNIQAVRNQTQAKQIFLAVKANAYGLGLLEMAKGAVASGIDGLCVAVLDEALALRAAGINVPILVMGIVPVQYAVEMAKQHIMATVSDVSWLVAAQKLLNGDGPLLVNIAVDTGMGRIGFRSRAELIQAIELIHSAPEQLTYQAIMTHFSDADVADDQYFKQQLQVWHALTDSIEMPPMVHLANSGAAIYHTHELSTEMVRVGSVIYGLEPSRGEIKAYDYLQPVLTLESELVFCKQMPEGAGISYGHRYLTKAGDWIGTVPIGYGDGLNPGLSGYSVLVNGVEAKIVGQIAMDQLMILLPKDMPIGSTVTFIGKNGDLERTIEDMALYTDIDPWYLTTAFQARLTRQLVE